MRGHHNESSAGTQTGQFAPARILKKTLYPERDFLDETPKMRENDGLLRL